MSALVVFAIIAAWFGLGYLGWRIGDAAVERNLKRDFSDYTHEQDGMGIALMLWVSLCGPLGLVGAALWAVLEDNRK